MTEAEIRRDERDKCAALLDACADDMMTGMRRPQAIRSLRALARLLRGQPAERPADMAGLFIEGRCRGCGMSHEDPVKHMRKCAHLRIVSAMVSEGVHPHLAADLAMQANPPKGGLNELKRQLRSKSAREPGEQ